MQFVSWPALFCAVSALFVYKFFSVVLRRRRNAQKAAARGCQPAPLPRDRRWFGLKALIDSVRATKDEWGPIWMHQTLNDVGKDVHTIHAPVFDYELIITRDAENAKAIFATQSQDFDIGLHREKTFNSLIGPGVMTRRGEQWKHSRALVRGQFVRENLADLPMLQRHAGNFIKRLKVGGDDWTEEVDLGPRCQEFTLDTGTEFLFGQSTYVQDPIARAKDALSWDKGGPDVENFGRHLDGAKHMLDRRGALTKYGWLLRDGEFPKHCKAVQKFVDYFVKQTLLYSDDEKLIETADGKAKFVLLNELAKHTRDPLELRHETLNVLHASRDTTAALMGWTFYFLAHRPDVFAKLRAEILVAFSPNPESEIAYSKLISLQYLGWVLNEVIRYVGVVPMNERMALRDTILPRGGGPDGNAPVFVPKGVQILIPTYSMQHREDIWGPDVEEFKPERWESRKSSWDFIPFGGGARQCLGQQFARTEASYVVVRMLQTFDQIENLDHGLLKMHHTIENRSGSGVQVRLHAASAAFVEKLGEADSDLDLGLGAVRRVSVS